MNHLDVIGDARLDMNGPVVSDYEFARFQRLIHAESGIFLTEAKKSLLAGRLQVRLRTLGLATFADYFQHVRSSKDELQEMLDRICTTETRFFRGPEHFAFLAKRWLPELISQANRGLRPRTLRIWSAACATGEEPYSLAMVTTRYLPAALGWRVEIVATDLCTQALRQAELGIWPIERASQVPAYYRKRFMLRGVRTRAGAMAAGAQLRACIRFQRVNLTSAVYPIHGPFDLIFCRNVLIYFERTTRQAVIRRLFEYLTPDGCLFLGHAESLHHEQVAALELAPNVYTQQRPASRSRRW